ncbi:MAG TPA: type 4a pilus biogenesis protein PilO [Gemmatimonadales bacterium]|nr:type 4a pilus biogenesis protein PilO [Gemmatimonadales bacterium]
MAVEQKQLVPIFLILVAGLVGYAGYTGSVVSAAGIPGIKPTKDSTAALTARIDSINRITDSAKKILASGSVEDLRRKLDSYRASLQLQRRLVPDRNEVPNLLDGISTRARIRGVKVAAYTPMPEESGPAPFNTFRYQMSVVGHYDQIGEFLADIASLDRIIVPIDLTLAPATQASAKLANDSTGALLEARFQIRTYVKTPNSEGESSGT